MRDKFITQAESDTLLELYDGSFQSMYNHTTTNLVAKMSTLECNYVMQSCTLMEGLIALSGREEAQPLNRQHLEHLYIFCLMWSVGALLELDDRAKMEAFLRETTELDLPVCEPGSGNTMFEFFVEKSGSWNHWFTQVEEYVYPSDSTPVYATILVPNVDNVRTEFLVQTVAKQEKVHVARRECLVAVYVNSLHACITKHVCTVGVHGSTYI